MSKAAAIQMTSSMDVKTNLEICAKLITQAVQLQSQLIVLPENFSYMGKDQDSKIKIAEKVGAGPIQDFLREQALKYKIWIVAGTMPIQSNVPEKPFNTCFVYNDKGEQAARYDKIHLFDVIVKPGQEVYQESAGASSGDQVVVLATPFGKLGLTVCYDIRFPELYRAMLASGVEIFTIPAAFTVKTGEAHWELFVRARAVENLCYAIGACQTGQHANGRQTYGHSLIVNPWGEMLASLKDGVGVITADIDLEKQQQIREQFPSLSHRKI